MLKGISQSVKDNFRPPNDIMDYDGLNHTHLVFILRKDEGGAIDAHTTKCSLISG